MPTSKHSGGDEPQTPAADARHPDTLADVGVQPPAQEELKPEDYGFRTIDIKDDGPESGPGAIPPTRVESVAGAGSTFSERAKASGKAVQSAENKSVREAESK